MKYFIDFEFIEGFHKPIFGKKRHFIDLISVGIVCEDGREYYAISKEFNPKDADNWVRENVINKLPKRNVDFYDSPRQKQEARLWKSNKQIAEEIRAFVYYTGWEIDPPVHAHKLKEKGEIEFYGYYCDYDWVLFCSLFGRMIDLPKRYPMYCIDLKQTLDEKAFLSRRSFRESDRHDSTTTEGMLSILKEHKDYPKQENEHNALADAKWNFELYKWLCKF